MWRWAGGCGHYVEEWVTPCGGCGGGQVVQEIKALRSSVTSHEREVAERATLVTQERLIKGKVRLPHEPWPIPLP